MCNFYESTDSFSNIKWKRNQKHINWRTVFFLILYRKYKKKHKKDIKCSTGYSIRCWLSNINIVSFILYLPYSIKEIRNRNRNPNQFFILFLSHDFLFSFHRQLGSDCTAKSNFEPIKCALFLVFMSNVRCGNVTDRIWLICFKRTFYLSIDKQNRQNLWIWLKMNIKHTLPQQHENTHQYLLHLLKHFNYRLNMPLSLPLLLLPLIITHKYIIYLTRLNK